METFLQIDPKKISENPFFLLNDRWALLTAGDSMDRYNTMTVSWGGVGVLWKKPVATVYVRPQRYTYGIMEKSTHFTLSFFEESYHSALTFCGAHSGRDCDKAKECGLTPVLLDGGVAFQEATLVLSCDKLYYDDMNPAHFLKDEIIPVNYPKRDFHRMYIGEITQAFHK